MIAAVVVNVSEQYQDTIENDSDDELLGADTEHLVNRESLRRKELNRRHELGLTGSVIYRRAEAKAKKPVNEVTAVQFLELDPEGRAGSFSREVERKKRCLVSVGWDGRIKGNLCACSRGVARVCTRRAIDGAVKLTGYQSFVAVVAVARSVARRSG